MVVEKDTYPELAATMRGRFHLPLKSCLLESALLSATRYHVVRLSWMWGDMPVMVSLRDITLKGGRTGCRADLLHPVCPFPRRMYCGPAPRRDGVDQYLWLESKAMLARSIIRPAVWGYRNFVLRIWLLFPVLCLVRIQFCSHHSVKLTVYGGQQTESRNAASTYQVRW